MVMCDYTSQTILVANLGLLKCVVGYKSGEYEVLTTDHGKTIDDFPFSKALGTKKYKFSAEPSVTEFEMPEDLDFVFVASDGVWELFQHTDELVETLYRKIGRSKYNCNLEKICEDLLKGCISDDPIRSKGYGCDNMTCILAIFVKY